MIQSADHPIIGLGEILWDLLPSGPQLGGAPFNFVFHCHQLGWPAQMVSRVGADEHGRSIRAELAARGLSDATVQEDSAHPTGTVTVELGPGGQPSYTIHENVAYDFLQWNPVLESLLHDARAVCFGTLVQRHPVARQTVRRCLEAASGALIVYDVNLRQHFLSREVIESSLQASRWVKLNDEELAVLRDLLGLKTTTDPETLAEVRHRYEVDLACLTLGAEGCLVQTEMEEYRVAGVPVEVVDTVGAGDSFTAALLVGHLRGKGLAQAAKFACRLAARVAGSAGGTPVIEQAELESYLKG